MPPDAVELQPDDSLEQQSAQEGARQLYWMCVFLAAALLFAWVASLPVKKDDGPWWKRGRRR